MTTIAELGSLLNSKKAAVGPPAPAAAARPPMQAATATGATATGAAECS
jgi:hypothetical protein